MFMTQLSSARLDSTTDATASVYLELAVDAEGGVVENGEDKGEGDNDCDDCDGGVGDMTLDSGESSTESASSLRRDREDERRNPESRFSLALSDGVGDNMVSTDTGERESVTSVECLVER
jgi:hypothetical protein